MTPDDVKRIQGGRAMDAEDWGMTCSRCGKPSVIPLVTAPDGTRVCAICAYFEDAKTP